MRSFEDHKKILQLWEQGYNKSQIAKMLGIPRVTIRDSIKRYGSVEGLEKDSNPSNDLNPDNQAIYREIMKLWGQGMSKLEIVERTGQSRYRVFNCIERYRSLEELEKAIAEGEDTSAVNNHLGYTILHGFFVPSAPLWFKINMCHHLYASHQ